MIKKLKALLIQHEGERLKPYHCPAGRLTIGVGRNLDDKGISHDEAMFLLANDIQEVRADLNWLFPDFGSLPENIRLVLCDMRFNLGPEGFRRFRRLREAVNSRNWPGIKAEMANSVWFHQVGQRAFNLVDLVNKTIESGGK